jgi:hypothetical protein
MTVRKVTEETTWRSPPKDFNDELRSCAASIIV